MQTPTPQVPEVRRTNITMRHIRVFLEIVSQRSMRGAAEALHVTESAVSKSLRELESELGTQLLLRGRKGVSLSPAGESFHIHATQSLISFSKAVDVVSSGERQREVLRIGALPTAAGSILPRAVHEMASRHPRYSAQIQSAPYEFLVGKLRLGELDMIVGRMVTRDTVGLAFELLYQEDIVAVARKEHPLVQAGAVSIAALANFPVIIPFPGTQVRNSVDDFFFANESRPVLNAIETLSDEFARAFAYRYDGVWFVPKGLVETDLAEGGLVNMGFRSHLLRAPIGLTTQANTALSQASSDFVDILRNLAHELG